MKRSIVTAGLLSVAMLATAAPVLAAPPQPECGPMLPPQAGPDGPFGPRHEGPGPMHGANGPGGAPQAQQGPKRPDGLELAARLSAAETYVGITSAQEDAWRSYTSALIAFFDRPEPPRGHGPGAGAEPHRDGGNPPSVEGEQADAKGGPAPLFSDRLANRAIEQGKKAQALKTAISELRSVLTEEQLARLGKAERSLAPKPGPGKGPDMKPGQGPDRGPGPKHFGEHGPDRPGEPGDMPTPEE